MTVRLNRKIRFIASLGVIAAGAVGVTALASPAYAETTSVLEASADAIDPIAPGSSGVLHHEVENVGTTPTAGLLINFQLPKHVDLEEDDQCEVKGSTPSGGKLVSCRITGDNGTLQPGEILNTDAELHVAQQAPAGKLGDVVITTVPLNASGQPTEDPSKLDGPNTVRVPLETVGKSYDLSVAATSASGKVGETVTVKGSYINHGPDDVVGGDATIVAPKGTELVSVPSDCKVVEDKRKIICSTDQVIKAGRTNSTDLKFKIVSSTIGKDGLISISTKTAGKDTKPENNSVAIAITVVGEPTSSTTPSTTPSNSNGVGGGGKDKLPVTGSNMALVAGSGAIALLAGGALMMMARRRSSEV